jgi:regulator of RNase E activity RraA
MLSEAHSCIRPNAEAIRRPPDQKLKAIDNCTIFASAIDWWNNVSSLPEPRVMLLQDAGHQPGVSAFVAGIHAAIGTALKCAGRVTNGAARDLPAVEAPGFRVYARHTSVSHSYALSIEFGEPAEMDGLKILSRCHHDTP